MVGHARSTVFTFRLLKLGLPQSPLPPCLLLLWPHLTPAAAHLHSVRLSNEICCLLLMLLLLLAVSLGKRCDLRLGLLHFLVKQNAQKVDSIHGQTCASSSWQSDEWTERRRDECLLFLARQWNVPWLPAFLSGWLPGCVSMALGRCCHTHTHTHTEEVVLWHAAHTVALALGKLWQQAQPGSPSQAVSQSCCLLRLLLLLPPLSLVLYFWRAVCQVLLPRCV